MSGQREEYMAMCLANFGSLLHDCFLAHSQFANFAFFTSCGSCVLSRFLNSCLSDNFVHVITLLFSSRHRFCSCDVLVKKSIAER